MHALKDMISEKLSELFSDSPSHSPTHGVDHQPQANFNSKEGRSLSSISPFLHLSLKKPTSVERIDDNKIIDSNSVFWRSKSFPLRDMPLERNPENDLENEHEVAHQETGGSRRSAQEKKEPLQACPENGDLVAERSNASDLDVFVDTPDSQSFGKYRHNFFKESVFMSVQLFDFFESCLPNIVKGCQWVLLYSTSRHGISLRTLIRRSCELSGPCLLIAGDRKGAIFGGLLDCPLRPTAKRKYQGTSQTFVFTTIYGEPRLFRPTGANRYYIMCLNDLLAFGGGGNFALSMEEDLLCGTSGACDTFGNLCLAHEQEFELKDVELWGFKHASNYLS